MARPNSGPVTYCRTCGDVEGLGDTLERLVDANGLATVLDALSKVAADKADHIRASYQDDRLAALWDHACKVASRAASDKAVEAVTP